VVGHQAEGGTASAGATGHLEFDLFRCEITLAAEEVVPGTEANHHFNRFEGVAPLGGAFAARLPGVPEAQQHVSAHAVD